MEEGKVEFRGLVAGIATSAAAVLGQVEGILESGRAPADDEAGASDAEPLAPEERQKRVADGLGGARQLIDTLAMLEEKTRGNLNDEERELLDTALSELRIRYVSLAKRPPPSGSEGKAG